MVSVLINDINITRFVDRDGFPDYFEESMKGAGYFDYQVRPFTFKVITGNGLTLIIDENTSITLQRQMPVILKDGATNEMFLNGFIDSIDDEFSDTPELTVFPNALLLKDTIVGTEISLDDETWQEGDAKDPKHEYVIEFDTVKTKPLAEIIQTILTGVYQKTGVTFTIGGI